GEAEALRDESIQIRGFSGSGAPTCKLGHAIDDIGRPLPMLSDLLNGAAQAREEHIHRVAQLRLRPIVVAPQAFFDFLRDSKCYSGEIRDEVQGVFDFVANASGQGAE